MFSKGDSFCERGTDMGRSGQVSKRQGLSRHVTWALLSTDRGGSQGWGSGRGEKKPKLGSRSYREAPRC